MDIVRTPCYLKIVNYFTSIILGNTTFLEQMLDFHNLDDKSMNLTMYIIVTQWLTGGSVKTALVMLRVHAVCIYITN